MKHRQTGFTLVELLVVIAILGVLMSLMLPAVQQARDAARRLTCNNNLKQLGQGSLTHESMHQSFPAGGWGWAWTGDPDRGFSWKQPGGWGYNVLPHIEQEPLYLLPRRANPDDLSSIDNITQESKNAGYTIVSTPIPVFTCPARRAAKAYPYTAGHNGSFRNIAMPGSAYFYRGDYGANGGDIYRDPGFSSMGDGSTAGPAAYSKAIEKDLQDLTRTFSGIMGTASYTKIRDIRDGASNTLMLGEKYIMPAYYETGEAGDDNEAMLVGNNPDIVRFAQIRPAQDRPGFAIDGVFGSCHSGIFYGVTCDNSLKTISYGVSHQVFIYLCNKADLQLFNMEDLLD